MKLPLTTLAGVVAALAAVTADEVQKPPTGTSTRILGGIYDGTLPAPSTQTAQLKAETRRHQILNTSTQRIAVEEPATIPGVPPVRGTAKLTIELVAGPAAEPQAPAPQKVESNPIPEDAGDFSWESPETRILFVSAMTGANGTTLTVTAEGQPGLTVTATSNLDFAEFGGFTSFEVEGRVYALILAFGHDGEATPSLPVADPAYQVTEGDAPEALQALADLRMRVARIKRDHALKEQRAELLAHPPTPKDRIIRFWKNADHEEGETQP